MSKRGEGSDKEAHKKRLSELREKTKRKIDYHLQKAYLEPEDFYRLITDFFMELLEKDYQATYEEVLQELEDIEHEFLLFSTGQREKANELLQELSDLQYGPGEISQEDARRILTEFQELAHEFTRFEEETVERALRQAYHALGADDTQKALGAYQHAHELYTHLSEADKQRYFHDLQELYQKIQDKQALSG